MSVTQRVAVIGAGVMGANHVRLAKVVPTIELVAVVDSDTERAAAAAGEGVAIFATVDELVAAGVCDAVVVAVPTPFHHATVMRCLEAGLHVLVEKPIAATLEEADEMIAAADSAGVTLMVGHVERFNPVIIELAKLVDGPIHIEADRVGPFSSRVKDSVVLDLMIHDLDIVRMLAGSDVTGISGVARSVRSEEIDLASVHLTFENGTTATLTASRLGQQKVRQVRVTELESHIAADLIRQDISVHRVVHVEYVAEGGTRYRQTGMVEVPFIETRGEPLALELTEFVTAIDEGRAPLVDGRAGRSALDLVERVHAAIQQPA
ncbi:MAG: Gfo/Idh/MocA family oxidoreductase [Microthrixaceae bacterium]